MSKRAIMRAFAVVASMLVGSAAAMAQQVPAWMKPGPGQADVIAGCRGCHTLNYIQMNSAFLTPDQWKAEVAKMRGAFGAPINDEMAAKILEDLAATYSAPPKS